MSVRGATNERNEKTGTGKTPRRKKTRRRREKKNKKNVIRLKEHDRKKKPN
jgi:hypothetical protein